MDIVGFVLGSIITTLGLYALCAAIFLPNPGQTRIIRFLSWPGTKSTDRMALPLASLITCMGATFLLTALPGARHLWVGLIFVVIGAISAVVLGLRRSET